MNRMYDFLLGEMMKYKLVRDNHPFWGNLDCLEYPKYYFKELKSDLENTLGEEINTITEANMSLKKTVK